MTIIGVGYARDDSSDGTTSYAVHQLAEQHQPGQFRVLYRRRFHRFLIWFLPGWLALIIFNLIYDGYRLSLDFQTPLSLNAIPDSTIYEAPIRHLLQIYGA